MKKYFLFDRRLSHLTPRYVLNRIKVFIQEATNPHDPWLTSESIKILEGLLLPTDIGVEFGSGRSTMWFARRLNRLTSIESDEAWYKKVKLMLNQFELEPKVDYRLFLSEQEYAEQALTVADESINFCLIDGINRDNCAWLMIPKIRPGGLMVIDNVNWFFPNDFSKSPDTQRSNMGCSSKVWQQVFDLLASWRLIYTSNGVSDTAIYIKP